jgi:hypothetical protein
MNLLKLRFTKDRLRSFRFAALLLVWLLTTLGCLNTPIRTRTPPGTSTPVETEPPIPTETPLPDFTFTLERLAAVVRAGTADPLSPVNLDGPQPFPEGSFVTVDASGEALLEGDLEGNRCKIFVFFDTRLQKKACPESAFTGSNVSCVEEGSAVFDRCTNMLIGTPSAEFQLVGTWLQTAYFPGRQASVLLVSEGQVEVYPVTDAAPYSLGLPVTVGAGQFLYTAPDDMLSQAGVPGLAPRQALGWEDLPTLMRQYNMDGWLDRGRPRAGQANVPFPSTEQLAGPPDLVIRLESREWTNVDVEQQQANPEFIGIPVLATVLNQGGKPAGPFKLSVDGITSEGTFVRAFTVPGQNDLWYPHTFEELAPGQTQVFEGLVFFSAGLAGEEVTLVAYADSCSGEELVNLDTCFVPEFDESNNASEPLYVILTRRYGPASP